MGFQAMEVAPTPGPSFFFFFFDLFQFNREVLRNSPENITYALFVLSIVQSWGLISIGQSFRGPWPQQGLTHRFSWTPGFAVLRF
jgi:hypothetical protein